MQCYPLLQSEVIIIFEEIFGKFSFKIVVRYWPGGIERESESKIEIERQTDRQTERQRDRQTERQRDRQTDREI